MDTFYMDEAGYTGFDLLNPEQRFQGASTIKLDASAAESIVREYFPNRQFEELKHNRLARRPSNWGPLRGLQERLLREHIVCTSICDKRYLLTLMFLNTCLEPAYYAAGADYYKDGNSYALASLIYRTGPALWGKDNFRDLMALFQNAAKNKTDVAIQALVQKARSLLGRELSEYLWPLAMEHPSCIGELKQASTDAAPVVLLSLIYRIEAQVSAPYCVVLTCRHSSVH
jgi:hypothetical protein